MPVAQRMFRLLLLAYPPRLRHSRGTEMWLAFRAHLDEARRHRRWVAMTRLWVQEVVAALTHGMRARRHAASTRSFPATPRRSPEDHMFAWLQDFRYALRFLRKSPGFAAVVIATLAVGIGTSTAMFTVVRGVLLTPLGFERPDEIVSVWLRDLNNEQSPLTPADYLDLARETEAFAEVAGRWSGSTSLLGEGEPEQISVGWVSRNYFETLGIQPFLGRTFETDEFDAVVIGAELWRRRYGADSTFIGGTVRLADRTMTVVGILPPGINHNVATVGGRREQNDVFRLWPEKDWLGDDRTTGWIRVLARARPDANRAAMDADLAAISRLLVEAEPRRAGTQFELYAVGILDELVASARPYLITLGGGVVFVFLIACFNVANLTLVRAHRRHREFAVRAAIGAGRGALARQLFVESATMAVVGAIGGIGLAYLATDSLLALQPANLPRLDTIAVDRGVLTFAAVAAFLSATIVGLAPAWRAARIDPGSTLQERAGTGSRRQNRVSNALIASEVALSLVLLTGSGLMLRTFAQLAAVDPGFEPERLITYSLSNSALGGGEEGEAFIRQVIAETEALPGVEAAGFSNRFPFAGGIYTGPFATEATFGDANLPEASFRWVSTDFLVSMGARILAGRTFADGDGDDLAVIDDIVAKRAWPGEDPLGKRIWTGSLGRNDWSTVIGVVQSMRHRTLTEPEDGTIFMPRFSVGNVMRAAIRTAGPPDPLIAQVRQVVRAIDPEATVGTPRVATELLADVLAPTRFAMLVIAVFAMVAVSLAAVGVFAVVSFSARQRTREFGLRMALGEPPDRIFRHVVGQGLWVTVGGIGAGLVGVALLSRFLVTMLFGVEPMDPTTLALGVALMAVTGAIGGVLPARRAARLDPAETLKVE